jgi:hypothetical protein
MKIYFYLILLSPFFFSCKSSLKNEKENLSSQTIDDKVSKPINLDTLKGMYIGDFGGSDIRIVINFISENHAVGYNVHKGLHRNISGKVFNNLNEVEIELNEPGDHEYDGVFYLKFNKEDLTCSGTWKSNSSKISKKKFTLEKVTTTETTYDLENLKLADITKENFPTIFAYCSDSVGDLFISNDGLCKYEFYPKVDTNERVEQLASIKGSWTLTKEKDVIINWQKNSYFKHLNQKFHIYFGKDSYDFYLLNDKHRIYPNLFAY